MLTRQKSSASSLTLAQKKTQKNQNEPDLEAMINARDFSGAIAVLEVIMFLNF